MIARYTLPDMGTIWSEENKLQNWLKIEIAACEGQALIGRIPPAAVEVIRKKADFNIQRVREIEAEVHHDVIAFLTNVAEYVGEESKYIHLGLTSSDILDTGLALQMRDAADLILEKLQALKEVVGDKAKRYKYTFNIGRTHGVHGEPSTFGLKMALWYSEIERNIKRLEQAREVIAYGAISGAVGNFAHIDPRVEEYVCKKLELKPCPISSQIIQRDRHAQFMTVLAITNPSTNSYKRLVPGYEAPVSICFATSNRSAVIRIPAYAKTPESKRFEFRSSDATCNPYLGFAAMLMAGLDGIHQKIDPVAEGYGPYDVNLYTLSPEEQAKIKSLPKSLDEALDALEKDHDFLLAGGVFPARLIEIWIKAKRAEAAKVNSIPHPMEFELYYDL
jgi:hypothetical protein